MKINSIHSTGPILAFLIVVLISGCNPIEQLQKNYKKNVRLNTEPELMEVHADTVELEIKGRISEGYLKKNAVLRFDPILSYNGTGKNFEPFYVREENVDVNSDSEEGSSDKNYVASINRKSGGSFSYSVKLPYEPKMKNSKLETSVSFKIASDYDSLEKCGNQEPMDTLTEGTITTPLTVKSKETVMMGGIAQSEKDKDLKPGESPQDLEGAGSEAFSPKNQTRSPAYGTVKPEIVRESGTIFFEINRSYIRASEKEGEEMNKIRNFAKQDQLKLSDIEISAFASPDGELDLNANLTQERANSTHDYLKKELMALGHSSVHDSDFNKEATTKEDWNGFKRLVQESDLDSKNEILKIANSNMGLDEKEDAIREMEVWEPYMVETLLPKLRRSEINLKGFLKIRPYDSIKAIADKHGLDSLHKKELLRLANRSNNIERKREIYENYSERNPDDWVGQNNLHALLLFEGRYEEAKEAFDKLSDKFPEVPQIKNNLGIANRHMMNYEKARDNYEFAKSKGLNVNNNLAILDIKVAEYSSATETFSEERCDYNVALAYTLDEQYEKALEKIDCITEKSADVFYLRAIIGARQGNTELMTTSLTRAIEKDSSIRERAKNDLEFHQYHGSEDFKNAIR